MWRPGTNGDPGGMTTNRAPGLPPFPEGSDWADPGAAFDASAAGRTGRRDSLIVLWTCFSAFPAIAFVLLAADTVIYEATNSDDIGPFDGLTSFAIAVFAVLFGALPLVVAVAHSVAAAQRKKVRSRRTSHRVALYTAACGLVTAPFSALGAYQTAQDRRVTESALHEAYAMHAATALIGLLPLVLYVALAAADRRGARQ